VKLEEHARCILTDSGTVQEECSILGRPNVTLRDVTERAETIECGSNILAGGEPESLLRAVQLAIAPPWSWSPPPEYLEPHASVAITKIVLGFHLSPIRDRSL
jgi:UDP-N-acetylglucosamine 2-epimerase (non-hydrolysing)